MGSTSICMGVYCDGEEKGWGGGRWLIGEEGWYEGCVGTGREERQFQIQELF